MGVEGAGWRALEGVRALGGLILCEMEMEMEMEDRGLMGGLGKCGSHGV